MNFKVWLENDFVINLNWRNLKRGKYQREVKRAELDKQNAEFLCTIFDINLPQHKWEQPILDEPLLLKHGFEPPTGYKAGYLCSVSISKKTNNLFYLDAEGAWKKLPVSIVVNFPEAPEFRDSFPEDYYA